MTTSSNHEHSSPESSDNTTYDDNTTSTENIKKTNTLNDDVLAEATHLVQKIEEQIGKAIIGQKQIIHEVLIAFLAGGNVLIEGVPGLGKTLLVKALAKSFSGEFSRIQFTPDLMPADVTGHLMFDHQTQQFNVRKGPAFTNLLLRYYSTIPS